MTVKLFSEEFTKDFLVNNFGKNGDFRCHAQSVSVFTPLIRG